MEASERIALWRQIMTPGVSWVLFRNGTLVILRGVEGDLAIRATALLRKWGPVHAGSSFGDFTVGEIADRKGWIVTCHHEDVFTLVGPDEVDDVSDLVVGTTGRSKRGQDAESLDVLHVEDGRGG